MKERAAKSGRRLPHSKTPSRNPTSPGLPHNSIITLTTDFGSKDWFVGTMKGVILAINPQTALVDITHEITPGDIRAGAFALAASCRFFPKGTVHVVVIDPGVGGQRRAIVLQTPDYLFVGPDNGVLSWAVANTKIQAIHLLQNERFFLQNISRTFHGRDVFAPVAAHLSCGTPVSKLGPRVKDLVRIPRPQSQRIRNGLRGEVIYVDRFGNAITNLEVDRVVNLVRKPVWVHFGGKRACRVEPFYDSVPLGTPVAVIGSTGFLELAINGGDATSEFGIRPGDAVTLQL